MYAVRSGKCDHLIEKCEFRTPEVRPKELIHQISDCIRQIEWEPLFFYCPTFSSHGLRMSNHCVRNPAWRAYGRGPLHPANHALWHSVHVANIYISYNICCQLKAWFYVKSCVVITCVCFWYNQEVKTEIPMRCSKAVRLPACLSGSLIFFSFAYDFLQRTLLFQNIFY